MGMGLYSAALGSREQQKRLEVISNNIANSGTAGFKKEVVRFENFLSQTTATNLEQGPIRATGNELDIALSGKGFLKAQTDQGVLYTRTGNLSLNRQGVLVTQDGWPVLGKGGPITTSGQGTTLRIEANGQVSDGAQNIGALDLVDFPPQTSLTRAKNGYFKPTESQTVPVAATDCEVQQGALEEANFNVVQEMAQMIDTMRNFEAYHKIIQSFDQIDAQLTSKLAAT
jgi:flagellar basal-body rod protein FlgF